MQDFIEQYLPTIAYVFAVVFSIFNMVYTRSTGKSLDKEVSFLKNRLPDYRESLSLADKQSEGQTFNPLVKQYKLDKHSDELIEKADMLDVQQLINSAVDTCLDRALARLMPEPTVEDGSISERLADTEDALDTLSEAFALADDYREKFNLSADLSVFDVFDRVRQYSDELQAQLDKLKGGALNVEEKKTDKPTEE